MSRQYILYYDHQNKVWKIIVDGGNGIWIDHIPNAGSEAVARQTVNLLNAQGAERNGR